MIVIYPKIVLRILIVVRLTVDVQKHINLRLLLLVPSNHQTESARTTATSELKASPDLVLLIVPGRTMARCSKSRTPVYVGPVVGKHMAVQTSPVIEDFHPLVKSCLLHGSFIEFSPVISAKCNCDGPVMDPYQPVGGPPNGWFPQMSIIWAAIIVGYYPLLLVIVSHDCCFLFGKA